MPEQQQEQASGRDAPAYPVIATRIRVANKLLRPGQRLTLALLTFWRTCVGICDLLFALSMLQLFSLLQSQPAAHHHWWTPHTVVSACVLTGVLLIARFVLDLYATRETVHHVQRLYTDLLLRLGRGYSSMRRSVFTQRNRSEMLKHATHTALDAAYFYQLIVEGISGLIVAVMLTAALLAESPGMIVGLMAMAGLLYLLHRFVLRERLARSGTTREQSARLLQRTFADALSAGKETRTYRNYIFFERSLQLQAARLSYSNVQIALLPQVSRLIAEQGIVLLFLVVIGVVQLRGGNAAQVLSLLVFYFVLSRRLLPLLSQMVFSVGQMQGAYVNLTVVSDELGNCEADQSASDAALPPAPGLALELKGVSYAFPDGPSLLQNVSMHVREGEVVLLRGASGAGKSSVLNLIAGLLEPQRGILHLDRIRIAYVPQETTLFDESVRTNLTFGTSGRTDAEILRMLELVQLAPPHCDLAQGLDTRVGDSGLLFSGGQRQRFGLARALLQNATLLLLDEATSAIDEESERLLLGRIASLGIAVLFVTHRPRNIACAHRAYLLQAGQLVEEAGTLTY